MTATMTACDDAPADAVVDAPLRLAPGVELLGEYRDSGFSRPQYLLRRPDGQVVLVSQLLYLVAAALVEHHHPAAVAETVGQQLGRPVSAANVEQLVTAKLRPTGVLATGDQEPVALARANPLLALTLRVGVVPERLHRALTTALRPLFHAPVVVAVLATLLGLDGWLIVHRDALMAAALQVAARPSLVLAVTGLVAAALAFPEPAPPPPCR